MNKQTIATNTNYQKKDPYGALSMPLYQCAAFEFDNAESMVDAFTGKVAEPDYSRVMNPTVTFFENRIKALTDAQNVFAFNSGMAAITSAFLAVASAGKNIVTSNHLFGNSFSLITKTLARFGVDAKVVDLTNLEAVSKAVDDNTCCIYLEVVTNPHLEVADLNALAEIAHSHHIPLIADSTMIPFAKFSAKNLGVDIEVLSSTKYVSGGATSLGGIVIDYGTFPYVNDNIRNEILFNIGTYMTPQAAYMQTLGIETLDARYRVQAENTKSLVKRLKEVPNIRVNHLSLIENPYHDLAERQFEGATCAMFTIDLETEKQCFDFINNLRIIHRATNLFDNKTLAIHPYSTIFGNFTPEQKAEMDIRDTTIRISVGLENSDDLYEDIIQALRNV